MSDDLGRVATPPGHSESAPSTSVSASCERSSRGDMQGELRPFLTRARPGLDEIVADNVAVFHAEMMSDTSLWLGLSDNNDGLLHVWIGIEGHKGRHVLVMHAEDQDRPTIVAELDRFKASRLASEGGADDH